MVRSNMTLSLKQHDADTVAIPSRNYSLNKHLLFSYDSVDLEDFERGSCEQVAYLYNQFIMTNRESNYCNKHALE